MPKLRNSPPLSAAIDSLIALGLAVVAVVWTNEPHIARGGVGGFLRIRLTLLNASFAVVFVILWKQCLTYLGLYRLDFEGLRRLVRRIAAGCAIMTAFLAVYLDARKAHGPIWQILLTFFVLAFVYEMGRALLCSRPLNWQAVDPEWVIIVGSGRRASKAWRELRVHHRTKRLLGFIDDRSEDGMAPDIASRLIGTVDDLPRYLLGHVVDELILAAPMRSCYDLSQRAVSIAEAAGVRVLCLKDVFTLTQETRVRRRSPLFFELVAKDQQRESAEAAKRVLDVISAATGIVLLAPVFLAIAVAIKLTSPGPVLFVQERHGYGRRPFRMFRFRSMAENARLITPVGRFLQRTLLEELPELWNVLLGDMSLVGPRPMTVEDVSHFDETQLLRRFSVRPGMTGSWQCAGLMPLSIEQGVALDVSYIDGWSLTQDLRILARTVPAAFKRAGANL